MQRIAWKKSPWYYQHDSISCLKLNNIWAIPVTVTWDFWQALPLMKGLCVCEAHSLCSHNAVFLCTHFFKDQSALIINGSEWIQWNSYHFKDIGSKAPLSFSCFSLPCLPETSHHYLSVKGVDNNLRPDFPMSQTACQSWTTLQKSIYMRQVIKLHAIILYKTSNIIDSNSYSPIPAIMAWIHINIMGCFWVTTSENHYEN